MAVAANLALLRGDPALGYLVPPLAEDAGLKFVAEARGRGLLLRLPRPLLRRLVNGWSNWLLHGIVTHYAVRKRYIEEVARGALAEGGAQLVVIGAGYDTLALRLHREHPSVRFYEVDHPATQRAKRAVIARESLAAPNLTLVAADLGVRALADVLREAPDYDAGARTMFVCEGVLMYLAPADVAALFAAVGAAGAPGSTFAFTFFEPDARGRPNFKGGATRLVDAWLRLVGEPYRWGIARDALPAFLAAAGFTLRAVATSSTFRERYLAPHGQGGAALVDGEYVGVAEREA